MGILQQREKVSSPAVFFGLPGMANNPSLTLCRRHPDQGEDNPNRKGVAGNGRAVIMKIFQHSTLWYAHNPQSYVVDTILGRGQLPLAILDDQCNTEVQNL